MAGLAQRSSRQGGAAASRLAAEPGRSGCRCRSPSSGSGSWTSSRAGATYNIPLCAAGGRWTRRAGGGAGRGGGPARGAAHGGQRAGPDDRAASRPSWSWPGPTGADRAAVARGAEAAVAGAGRPFDLPRNCRYGPGCSTCREEHVLVLVVHHIASDGWSVAAAAGRPGAAYAGPGGRRRRTGSRCRCSTPTTPCGSGNCSATSDPDSIVSTQLDYWREPWPGRRRKPAARRPAPPGLTPARLGGPFTVTAAAPGLACRWPGTAATLFMVLQAALAALLHAARRGHRRAVGTLSPVGRRRRWTTWLASSSTLWCCAPTPSGDPTSGNCWPGRGTALDAYADRTCRSTGWWRSQSGAVYCPPPAVADHAHDAAVPVPVPVPAGAGRRGPLAGRELPADTGPGEVRPDPVGDGGQRARRRPWRRAGVRVGPVRRADGRRCCRSG